MDGLEVALLSCCNLDRVQRYAGRERSDAAADRVDTSDGSRATRSFGLS